MTEYDAKAQEEDIRYIRGKVLRKFPLLGVTMASLETYPNSRIKTACTDGKNIYYSPKFFAKLSDEEKVFVYAHEVMHVAFNHIMRSKGRQHKLWNIATDSVINQILKEEGLPLVKGGVNIAEALNKSAEEMYEKLLKEREEKRKRKEEEERKKQEQNKENQDNSQSSQDNPEQQNDNQEQENHENDNQQKEDNEQNNPEQQNDNQEQKNPENEQQKNPEDDEQNDDGDYEEENSDENSDDGKDNDTSTEEDDDGDDSAEDGEFDEDDYDDLDDENEDIGHADHQIWKQAIEEIERQQAEQEAKQAGNAGGGYGSGDAGEEGVSDGERTKGEEGEFEKGFVSNNKEERAQQIQRARQMIERSKAEATSSSGHSFGDVGEVKRGEEAVDWKKLLKNSIEKEEMRWSYRRSSAENNYMARVEELESDGQAETEVMLDVSGSVNQAMIKEFLRQLKPILKKSKLKVGCFDDRVFDFVEIKKDKDIDEFIVPGGGGTNLDKAVRAFSKSKKINKIIFTDGQAWGSDMPQEDLKGTNVLWLIYDNRNFNPCCGKVIYVDKKQFTHSSRSAYTTSSSRDYPY
ncbi:MAG: hypothetical protein IJZ59_06230 [Alphaproteobacteria bacterium]|nr:hypothetical protein [Alphaproteobacteria bacterium]